MRLITLTLLLTGLCGSSLFAYEFNRGRVYQTDNRVKNIIRKQVETAAPLYEPAVPLAPASVDTHQIDLNDYFSDYRTKFAGRKEARKPYSGGSVGGRQNQKKGYYGNASSPNRMSDVRTPYYGNAIRKTHASKPSVSVPTDREASLRATSLQMQEAMQTRNLPPSF